MLGQLRMLTLCCGAKAAMILSLFCANWLSLFLTVCRPDNTVIQLLVTACIVRPRNE